jgi:virulence-associated protein VagC
MSLPREITSSPTIDRASPAAGLRVTGGAVVYRLFDVGYEIHLDRALELLAASTPVRERPLRGEAQAMQIANPPVGVTLGDERIVIGGRAHDATMSARIFDFGVVSLRLHVDAPRSIGWEEYWRFGNAVDVGTDLTPVFQQHLRGLFERITPAIERPAIAPVSEDYIVFRIRRLEDPGGRTAPAEALGDDDIIPLLLNESRSLSTAARRELLPHRFSYYADDLTILTWDNALVLEPVAEDTDVQYILEFANAQLLELRFYDAMLDKELTRMYDRIVEARAKPGRFFRRRFTHLLTRLLSIVADSTELVERAENSLKVTDDVYLARIYSAALEIFRARAWRAGIDRKLAIIRDTYSMLNAEGQAARGEALELAIVLLFVLEIVLASFVR